MNDNPLPRTEEIGKAAGKRKALQPQAIEAHREESKSFLSHHSKSSDGKSSKGNIPHSKTNRRAKEGVGNQLGGVGSRESSGLFVLGSDAGFMNENGPNQGPFLFSSSSKTETSPKEMRIEAQVGSLRRSNYGENRKVGDFLQGKGYSNRGQDNIVDKAGPNRNLGVVRSGVNVGMEEFVSTYGGE